MSVSFPDGLTGSSLLHEVLEAQRSERPEVFEAVPRCASTAAFKRSFGDVLVRFEACRVQAPQRVAIARALASSAHERAEFSGEPLLGAVSEGGAPGDPVEQPGQARPGWGPRLQYGGREWQGPEIADLADQMRADHQLTDAAADALRWVAEAFSGPIDLSGQRFAVLGANAELAPTPYLLEAGARVLWVDRVAPALDPETYAGTVVHRPQAMDLLAETPGIRTAVSEEGDVHLGMYAYAPGRGRELLLTVAMNAVASAVDPASVAMLISPTTPGVVSAKERADRVSRTASVPGWQRALRAVGALGGAPTHEHGDAEVARSIVPLQGATYQAAQYLTKMMVAEAWAYDRAPMRMSANVAGITHTQSLEHPLFLAGFLGAPAFGIHVFEPEQTRVLMTLMMLHDVLRPDAPASRTDAGEIAVAEAVSAQVIHGGLRSAPYELDGTIRVTALMGLARRPSLLWRR